MKDKSEKKWSPISRKASSAQSQESRRQSNMRVPSQKSSAKQPISPRPKPTSPQESLPEKVRLVRFLALAGVASRRKAVNIILNGQVTVNQQVVKEPWLYVDTKRDVVTYRGNVIRPEKPVYILLNKPKNTICTLRDEKGRQTVMSLLEGAPPVRLYPIGRLDRNTTGILLLTNDGSLAQKLLHPSTKVPRTYRVTTVKPMNEKILRRLLEGIPLSDGVAQADAAELEDPYTLLLTVHLGRKHIVRRMLEHLGYRVKSLDRIAFGPINRKGVPRGQWRYLTPQEVGWLKMLPNPKNSTQS
ncbi:MAG: rRNA pseudouridine synthase [Bacteroidia bacterium]|nr:rRNA pseudouridine synthase [Bacteroidia bacterium]MCX7652535.1 rRNA pseudouridine synthase [Bacteroidia bacterium]MDW8417518.1 pseudouridine synthase [Bacteroidia bacterium]